MLLGVLFAVVLLLLGVGALYWLLKSMGEDGIEAAAPGSCRSGRCGVTPKHSSDINPDAAPVFLGSVPLGSVSRAPADALTEPPRKEV